MYDIRLVNGSSLIVSGPTQSGKTTLVHEILANHTHLFKNAIQKIYWICHEIPIDRKNFTYIEGVPDSFDFVERNSIVVLDDLMTESMNSPAVTNLFTRTAHHKNCFVIYITQNFFSQSKDCIIRRRNCQYLVLFKNPADCTFIRSIGQKMFPCNPQFLTNAYSDAVKRPHGYLFLDMRQETNDLLRVRTNILPREYPPVIYKQSSKCYY